MFRNRYRKNPTITIVVKRPHAPVITMQVDSATYSDEFKKIIGADYELHTYASLKDGSAIIMAVDEHGAFKPLLPLNWVSERFGRIIGTAIFIKEGADGELTSVNDRDIRRIKTETGDVSSNPSQGSVQYEVTLSDPLEKVDFYPAKSPSEAPLAIFSRFGREVCRFIPTPPQIIAIRSGRGTIEIRGKQIEAASSRGYARNPMMTRHNKCGHCNGEGLVYSGICPICHGDGSVIRHNPAKHGTGLYEEHEDVGKYAISLTDLTVASGVVVPAGTRGKIVRVEPAASTLIYLVETETHGLKGFSRNQITIYDKELDGKWSYPKKFTRRSRLPDMRRNPMMTRHNTCGHCNGQGLVYSGICPICHGDGQVVRRHNPCPTCILPLFLRNPDSREQLENKYQALVIKKHTDGVNEQEIAEMTALASQLDALDAPYYEKVIRRLRESGPKAPRRLRRRNPDRDWGQFVPDADEPEMDYIADDEALPDVWKRYY